MLHEPRCMVCGAPLDPGAPFQSDPRKSEVCSDGCFVVYMDAEDIEDAHAKAHRKGSQMTLKQKIEEALDALTRPDTCEDYALGLSILRAVLEDWPREVEVDAHGARCTMQDEDTLECPFKGGSDANRQCYGVGSSCPLPVLVVRK